jgi:hypothetical protein
MSIFARLRPHANPGSAAVEYLRALEAARATEAASARLRSMQAAAPAPTSAPTSAPTPGQVTASRHRVRLVAEDLDTGERVVLAETSWRSIEVLGSAARYYAAHYDNPQRRPEQVRARRAQASKLGAAIWDTAEATVGIETP